MERNVSYSSAEEIPELYARAREAATTGEGLSAFTRQEIALLLCSDDPTIKEWYYQSSMDESRALLAQEEKIKNQRMKRLTSSAIRDYLGLSRDKRPK